MKEKQLFQPIMKILIKMLIILLAFVTAMSSYGWFAANKTLQHQNLQMSLRSDDAIASYKVYKFDLEKGSETYNKGIIVSEKTVTDEEDDTLTIGMNEYDTIFTKRNRYTPAFIRIELFQLNATPKSGTINVTLTKKDFDEVQKTDASGNPVTDSNGNPVMIPCISQVVRFTAKVDDQFTEDHKFSTIEHADISPKNIDLLTTKTEREHLFYTYVDEVLYNNIKHAKDPNATGIKVVPDFTNANVDNSKIFYTDATKVENDGKVTYTMEPDADGTITLSATYDVDNWSEITVDGETQKVLNVYIYLTYDDGLIECYKANHNMNILSIGEDIIEFADNLDQIKISFDSSTGGGSN